MSQLGYPKIFSYLCHKVQLFTPLAFACEGKRLNISPEQAAEKNANGS